ncbi:MAG: tripartite tricarboxylate transporter TctB family protein [Afipia sp.]
MRSIFSQKRDLCSGLLVSLIGAGAILQGVQYPLGTLANIGPGMFPTGIGALLTVVGIAIAVSGLNVRDERENRAPDWRGWGCIIGGTLAFAILGAYAGLVAATFALVFISALGDRTNTILQAAILAAAMVVVSVVVFWWALQLQMPLLPWS